jgi:hypothetical protein
MITSKNRLTRRSVLRGACGAAMGLPFLSAMLPPNVSHAQDGAPLRLVVFFSPGGTLLDQWRPTVSAGGGIALSSMLAPLTPFQDRLTFVDGLDLSVTQLGAGHPHSRGMAGILTGQQLLPGELATNGGSASFADGPSVDQLIAQSASAGLRFKSIELAAGWSTGLTVGGAPHPANIITYAGSKAPIPPQADPLQAFQRIFEGVAGDQQAAAARRARSSFVLDRVMEQYRSVAAQLGGDDRARLEAHATELVETEKRLNAVLDGSCTPPGGVNTTPGYYDEESYAGGDGQNVTTGSKVPEKGRIMTDLLVSAMACDLTRVGTMQWGDSEACFLLKFLNSPSGEPLADHHHGYQHDRGFQPGALGVIHHWYAENFAYLLERMAAVDEGDGSLLDHSLVLWVTEIQMPESHAQDHMPLVLAGGAGGKLVGGRHLQVASQPHNNLLVSILNLFGSGETTFGHRDFCTGPLAGVFG